MSDHPGDAVADELLELLASWQRHLRAAELSKGTLGTYGQSIRSFAKHLRTAANAPGDVTGITRVHVEDWVIAMREAGRAPWTVLTRYSNLRALCAWLVIEDELDVSPMQGMREPKVVQQPVPVIAVDALRALLDTCSGREFNDRRDEALIRAYTDGGMRLSECSTLTVDDADMDQQVFWVHGKGGRTRAVPFGLKTARAVDRYLRARRRHKHAGDTDRLWLGHKGPFTNEGVRQMLQRRAELAGIGHIHAHQLRHTAAHQLRLAGMNDQDMRRIFGWRSNKMLERYGESAAEERAREAHRRLSFGDQL